MVTFDTTESRQWLDTKCVSCGGSLRTPVSVFGHLLLDHYQANHQCQVKP